ncbi:hypothetical protein DPMN_003547 [Dreissena polymorpha]|uniref:Uncharacterized protein n=1 Tax=Dreissena polymorpha TaxID=45954 RepID=A0A9D4MQ38_DREPO|nr:hypothetical protein DPMN_003547 [Dreissena polymorpha]
MPGSSASISDATVTQTLLGKFTTTDPDTTCSVTSPESDVTGESSTTCDNLTTLFRNSHQRWFAGGRGDHPYVQRHRQRRRCHVLHTSAGIHLFLIGSRN